MEKQNKIRGKNDNLFLNCSIVNYKNNNVCCVNDVGM